LGTGPFRSGSIRKSTEFAGEVLAVPFFPRGDETAREEMSPGITVDQPAAWYEAPKVPAQIRWAEHEEGKKGK
jgi:hypothetical protein